MIKNSYYHTFCRLPETVYPAHMTLRYRIEQVPPDKKEYAMLYQHSSFVTAPKNSRNGLGKYHQQRTVESNSY